MRPNAARVFHLTTLMLLAWTATAWSASPVSYTTIHVDDMHCGDCAKKIANKLYAVQGVVEVRADVAKSIAYVVPQKDKRLSPKALWEAVEKAGFKPVRLESPDATFKQKPKS